MYLQSMLITCLSRDSSLFIQSKYPFLLSCSHPTPSPSPFISCLSLFLLLWALPLWGNKSPLCQECGLVVSCADIIPFRQGVQKTISTHCIPVNVLLFQEDTQSFSGFLYTFIKSCFFFLDI